MSSITSYTEPGSAPRLLEQVRARVRFKHYSLRAEPAYANWIRRFIRHCGKRNSREMSVDEVRALLTHPAVAGRVAASTRRAIGAKRHFSRFMCFESRMDSAFYGQ